MAMTERTFYCCWCSTRKPVESGFREIGTSVDRAIVDTADLKRERVGLRGDQEIRAKSAEFVGQTVAYVERDAQGGGGYRHAQS